MSAYRVGTHYRIHVYEDDRPVATFVDPDEAERFVEAMNCSRAAVYVYDPPGGTELGWVSSHDSEDGRSRVIKIAYEGGARTVVVRKKPLVLQEEP